MKALREVKGIPDESSDKVTPDEGAELADALLTAIDSGLEQDNGFVWKQSTRFTPSGKDCPRYLGYRLKGFSQKVDFDGRQKRIFENGHKLEDRLSDYLDGLGILVDREREVSMQDPPVLGFVDFVIDWDGEKPVECKSINDAGFQYRLSYNKPTDAHYRQLQVYLHIGGWPSGFVFYENKNNQAIKIFHVKYDPDFVEKLFKKWRKVYAAHEGGILSVRPYKQTSKNCQQCDAFDHCWKDTEEGVKL